jgi:hypothetical protein
MSCAPAAPPAAVAVELAAEALRRGRVLRERARGGSMRPLVPAGSELLVCPCDPAALAPGAVVLLALPGPRLVAHRLLLPPRPGRPAVTKGDRAPRPDPPGELLGQVTAVTPPRGARRDLTSPAWRVLGLVVALASPWAGLAWIVRRGIAPPVRPSPRSRQTCAIF